MIMVLVAFRNVSSAPAAANKHKVYYSSNDNFRGNEEIKLSRKVYFSVKPLL